MSNQFKIRGLESNNQVTPGTTITIFINKDVHSNFTNRIDLNFEIDGNKVPWPSTNQGIPADTYSFTPAQIGLKVSPTAYDFSLSYIDNSTNEISGDTLGSISVRVVGIVSREDDPNTYITAPFVSRINGINLQAGTIDLQQSWTDFKAQVKLDERQIPETIFDSAKISYKANEVRDLNNYVNFGDDNKILITNLKADRELFPESPYSIVLKL